MRLVLCIAVALSAACHHSGAPLEDAGLFRALTYNVAGLPAEFSQASPDVNTAKMSPLLNAYDVVVVQEDFVYHDELSSHVEHAYRSAPKPGGMRIVTDGLNRFSHFPLGTLHRERWRHCNGYFSDANDCLSDKGLSVATIHLGERVEVDVYNIHFDAGYSSADARARRKQVRQLARLIEKRSTGRGVIVAGDTNLRVDDDADDAAVYGELLRSIGLVDTCDDVGCNQPDSIDRVFYRNAKSVKLQPVTWAFDERFVDDAGNALSDHPAVGVEFRWQTQL